MELYCLFTPGYKNLTSNNTLLRFNVSLAIDSLNYRLGLGHFGVKIKNGEVLNLFVKTKNTTKILEVRFSSKATTLKRRCTSSLQFLFCRRGLALLRSQLWKQGSQGTFWPIDRWLYSH